VDRKLSRSLSEFDGILMREQKALAEDRAAASGGAGGEEATSRGAGSGAGARDEPGDDESAHANRGGGTERADVDDSGDPGESVGDEDEAVQAGRVPEDVGDGRDDDVVARQLREAAMSEEDPELREKLWEEYREYKRSTGR
jgi:hypothetical protein